MKLPASAGGAHLAYCTNIHRGETWAETRTALECYLPQVKARVSPEAAMGVGLRLSALASEELAAPKVLDDFREFLALNGLYVFTINGFPYGPFHGTRVKEEVYQPDWRFAERLTYSNRLADLLSQLLPDEPGLDGSVSTVPATFGPVAQEAGALAQITDNLIRHACHLALLREKMGRTIALAIEPEPMCHLETTEGAIDFIEERLYVRAARARFANLTGFSLSQAEDALRRHLGLCFDVCHAAVEFEEPEASFRRLAGAGIGVFKLQLSAALKVPEVGSRTRAQLERFDDGVYLHQVVERRPNGELVRFLDLGPAFNAIPQAMGSEWRVHCHVPVFHDTLPELGTTQDVLRDVLAFHKRSAVSRHLEVETYTFDVLPQELRDVGVAAAVAREIEWVKNEIKS